MNPELCSRRALLPATLVVLVTVLVAPGGCTRGGPAVGSRQEADSAMIEPSHLKEAQIKLKALEGRVLRLQATLDRISPAGPIILVDTAAGRIALVQGSRVIAEGKCSSGSGMELNDSAGKRSWTFDTPRGFFRVLSKVADPVWFRPDWSYIEDGEPIPGNRSQRATADVLGDYAISFGNGFFIHGTLYTRLLGTNVTHGCIRVDDVMLNKLYRAAHPGTSIWIY